MTKRNRDRNRVLRQKAMLELINEVIKMADTEEIKLMLLEVRDRVRLPMRQILALVPGTTITERAERIGIARQTYYSWWRGQSRPNSVQAKHLAHLTKIPLKDIHRTRTELAATATASLAPAAERRL